jgi:hypothetical protein
LGPDPTMTVAGFAGVSAPFAPIWYCKSMLVASVPKPLVASRQVPVAAIKHYAATRNDKPKPFIRTAKAAEILWKVIRADERSNAKQNQALR